MNIRTEKLFQQKNIAECGYRRLQHKDRIKHTSQYVFV